MPAITNGATAPAVHGKNDKNTIQNFFNRVIVFKYITFCPTCDIIEMINITAENVFVEKNMMYADICCGVLLAGICVRRQQYYRCFEFGAVCSTGVGCVDDGCHRWL